MNQVERFAFHAHLLRVPTFSLELWSWKGLLRSVNQLKLTTTLNDLLDHVFFHAIDEFKVGSTCKWSLSSFRKKRKKNCWTLGFVFHGEMLQTGREILIANCWIIAVGDGTLFCWLLFKLYFNILYMWFLSSYSNGRNAIKNVVYALRLFTVRKSLYRSVNSANVFRRSDLVLIVGNTNFKTSKFALFDLLIF